MVLEVTVLGIALAAILAVLVYTLVTGTPPTPTSPAVREAVLAVLPESIEGPVFELGAGWGGLVDALARRYPDRPVRAFERSLLPWMVLWVRRLFLGTPNLTVTRRDFMKVPLGEAALVVFYLVPGTTERLRPKLEAELAPGTLVLTHTFAVQGWFPLIENRTRDLYGTPVYLYRVGDV